MSQAIISQSQRETVLAMAKTFDVNYAGMEVSRLYWYSNCLVMVPLANSSGRYCLNKQA